MMHPDPMACPSILLYPQSCVSITRKLRSASPFSQTWDASFRMPRKIAIFITCITRIRSEELITLTRNPIAMWSLTLLLLLARQILHQTNAKNALNNPQKTPRGSRTPRSPGRRRSWRASKVPYEELLNQSAHRTLPVPLHRQSRVSVAPSVGW